MKNINLILIVSLFSCLQMFTNNVLAYECTEPGLANGSQCHFIDCECASDVCVNGTCVQCASNSDCQNGQSCIDNSCQ